MSASFARRVGWTFFTLNVLAVVWPGLTWFNRVEPRILGLPFVMAWLTAWLVAALLIMAWIEHVTHGLKDPEAADAGSDAGLEG